MKLARYLPLLLLAGCSGPDPSITSTPTTLRVSTAQDPITLDPRQVRLLPSVTLMHMLYEGLTRYDQKGLIANGIADNVQVSHDGKTYTFHLKKTVWNNGDPLTADDFVRTWKSALDPKNPSPNAYQLYPIKNAQLFHQGKTDSIGVASKGPYTLEVQLENPLPYFLDLTATHFYYPVHSSQSEKITNGPFSLEHWKKNNEISTVKNPHYWDAPSVSLDRIIVMTLEEGPAYHLFATGDLDWAGSPMSTLPQDSITTLKDEGKLKVAPAAGTHWYRFNTEKVPFNNENIRKAFSYALDRKSIVEHVTQGNQSPALQVVPPSLLPSEPYIEDNNTIEAWKKFQQGLTELKIDKDHFPQVTLCYAAGDRNHKVAQAVQQQWNKAFGITIQIQSCEGKSFMDKISKLDYEIGAGSWFADIKDPISFLEVFKFKTTGTNNTGWEDPEYTRLLNVSMGIKDPAQRLAVLKTAEAILMDDMPIAPLFHSSFNYLHKDNLYGVYVSELGFLDFSHAFFNGSPIIENDDLD